MLGYALFGFFKVPRVCLFAVIVVPVLFVGVAVFKAVRAVNAPTVKQAYSDAVLGAVERTARAYKAFAAEFRFSVLYFYIVDGAVFCAQPATGAVLSRPVSHAHNVRSAVLYAQKPS